MSTMRRSRRAQRAVFWSEAAVCGWVPLLLLALSAAGARAGSVSPRLQDALVATGPDQMVRVLVTLQSPAASVLRIQSGEAGEAAGRAIRIQQLREVASQARRILLRDLMTARIARSEEEIRPRGFWLTNAVALSLRPDQIATIAGRDDVIEVAPLKRLPPPRALLAPASRQDRETATWALRLLRVPQIRELYGLTGRGIVIGHLDTGVDATHPDLEGKVLHFRDFTGSGRAGPYDDEGHGTHTAASLVGGNASGRSIGVAPEARLVSARVFNKDGADPEAILKAMEWVLDPDGDPTTADGPRIISNSWGSDDFEDRTFWDATRKWIELGVFPLFATGNTGQTAGVPAAYPFTFSVGAVDKRLERAAFSAHGPVTWDGETFIKPQIVGPGTDILSAWPKGNRYSSLEGTSMACPHVTGIAALIAQARPDLAAAELADLLTSTALDLGQPGQDHDFGHGLVDPLKALGRVLPLARFSGRIRDGSGALIASSVWFPRHRLSLATDREGRFSIALPPGEHVVWARAEGRSEERRSVRIEDRDVEETFTLGPARTVVIRGRVTDRSGGAPLQARIRSLTGPVRAPAESDPATGAFRLELPEGSHILVVTAPGHRHHLVEDLHLVAGQPPGDLDLSMGPRPDVLLVDDDASDLLERSYVDALGELGRTVATWDTRDLGDVPREVLLDYPLALWQTGFDYQTALTPDEQDLVRDYLGSGGHLYLAGQVAGVMLQRTAYYKDVLHARWQGLLRRQTLPRIPDLKGIAGDPIGDGLELTLNGDGTQDNQNFPTMVGPGTDRAATILEYAPGVGPAGIRVDDGTFRLVYTGFGLEGVAPPARTRLLGRILAWLEPDPASLASRLARSAGGDPADRERRETGPMPAAMRARTLVDDLLESIDRSRDPMDAYLALDARGGLDLSTLRMVRRRAQMDRLIGPAGFDGAPSR